MERSVDYSLMIHHDTVFYETSVRGVGRSLELWCVDGV